METRVNIIVQGRVQGVFFRATTKEVADKLKLTGWVRNLDDGERVEIVAEGPINNIQEIINWAQRGPEHAIVKAIDSQLQRATGEFSSFEISY